MRKTFVSFGFGPISSGLFLLEAFRSARFDRLVVLEVVPEVVAAIRESGGAYSVNVAGADGLERHRVEGVEIYNPGDAADHAAILEALTEASEIATALPSVAIFDKGSPSVAGLLAEAATRKATGNGPRAVVYTGENHNHAAELLAQAVARHGPDGVGTDTICFLNTVIGKMSGVVQDPAQMQADDLAPMTPNAARAFLVEAFNRIMISRIDWPDFDRCLSTFIEKDDLLPFEEAKLYGHNATHALVGYLAHEKGYVFMSDVASDAALSSFARTAFLDESGAALMHKHGGTDPLFTPDGFTAYADDLLQRMMNPWLRDRVDRITRDPRRKLGWDDRLIGTMRLALDAGLTPHRYARAAALAMALLREEEGAEAVVPKTLWPGPDDPPGRQAALMALIRKAGQPVADTHP